MVDWGLGSYERTAAQLRPAAEAVVDLAELSEGETVVDVGSGTGNAALLAAERGASVIGVDPAERLLEVAAATTRKRGLDAEFILGEAASMPLPDGTADVEVSVFGVIFAPDAEAAAAEMTRILRPHGRILISAWIPEGAISDGVRMIRETMAEITGQSGGPQFAWHEPEALLKLFEPHGFSLEISEQSLAFTSSSPREYVEAEAREHPMAVAARPLLEEGGRDAKLERRLIEHYSSANEDPDAFRVTSRYRIAVLRR